MELKADNKSIQRTAETPLISVLGLSKVDGDNKTTQSFNKIFIVDSLLDTDLQTGSELYNDNIRWGTAEQIPALESNFTRVNNKVDGFVKTIYY